MIAILYIRPLHDPEPPRLVDIVTLYIGQKKSGHNRRGRGTINVDDDRDMQKDVDYSSARAANQGQEYRNDRDVNMPEVHQ